MAGPRQVRPLVADKPVSRTDDEWERQDYRKADRIAYRNKRTGRIEWVNETLSVWLTSKSEAADVVEAILNDPPEAEGSGPFNAMRAARSLSLRRAIATLRGDEPVEEVW